MLILAQPQKRSKVDSELGRALVPACLIVLSFHLSFESHCWSVLITKDLGWYNSRSELMHLFMLISKLNTTKCNLAWFSLT